MEDQNQTLKQLLIQNLDLEKSILEMAGELTPDSEALLSELEIKIPAKVSRYMGLIDRLETEAQHFANKAKKFDRAAEVLTLLKERLLSNVKHTMLENGLSELRGEDESFAIKKSKKSVVITDLQKIPRAFVTTTVTDKPDKEGLRLAMERGEIIPGCSLQDSYSLGRKVLKTK